MVTHYDMTSGEIIANSDTENHINDFNNTTSENNALYNSIHESPQQLEIQLVPVDLISEQIEMSIPTTLTNCDPTKFINTMRKKLNIV